MRFNPLDLIRPVLDALAMLVRAFDPANRRVDALPDRMLADMGLSRDQVG